jgi:excisionase family DNA binding protein
MNTIDHNELLTPEELAGRLKVGKSWVYEKTRTRSRDPLPVIRIGKYIRFHWPDVATWLEAHKQGT